MATQSFGADQLCTYALKPGAKEKLEHLAQSGELSPKNIVELLSPAALRNRKLLREAIAWIGAQVREKGAQIVVPALTKPVATKKKPERTYEKGKTVWSEQDITPENAKHLEGRSFMQRLVQHTLLTEEEEVALCKLASEGDLGARNKLVRQNQRYVVTIAKRYLWSGLELDDLVQEGNLGLLKAIDKFDLSKGYRLTTYATWWIRQVIQRAIMNDAALIRVPAHLQERYQKILAAREKLRFVLKRDPTEEEIAAQLEWTAEQVKDVLVKANFGFMSLDQTIGEEDDGTPMQETIVDTGALDACVLIEATQLQLDIEKQIKAILWYVQTTSAFPPRTITIFRERYGLQHGHFQQSTLEMVASNFSVTRERIRQILARVWEIVELKFDLNETKFLERVSQLDELQKITGIESNPGRF